MSDTSSTTEVANNSNTETEPKPQIIYRCRKCRRIVATQENVVPHERGEGQKCFQWKKRSESWESNKEPPECTSIFVEEPMKWMEVVEEGGLGDKLQCFNCKARLGTFSWVGMQCNCSAWVTPAFQLHRSRLDECHI